MRRKISLYIADQQVDLDDQSFILFNYTMEDLSNPTIVKNSFSQQITIKGTPANNRIFGGSFRLDRRIANQGGNAGVDFNASQKTPFAIYNEINEILESGYVKLDSVSRKGTDIQYKITLYGGLGSFFYALSYDENGNKRTLADLDYLGTGNTDTELDFAITKEDVSAAWDRLQEATDISTIWDVINFAPAYNGIPESNFSADKALVVPSDVGLADSITQGTGTEAVTYTLLSGYGLVNLAEPQDEWAVKDLRSYMQRPVFSMKAFIDAICDSANNGGYEVDASAVQGTFPFANLWMTLPMITSLSSYKQESGSLSLTMSSQASSGNAIGRYDITGSVPSGTQTTTNIHCRVRFNVSGANSYNSLATSASSRVGQYTYEKLSAIFIQAVAYGSDDNVVGGSKILQYGVSRGTSRSLAELCGYTPAWNADYQQINISAFNKVSAGVFEIPAELNFEIKAQNVAYYKILMAVYPGTETYYGGGGSGTSYYSQSFSGDGSISTPVMYVNYNTGFTPASTFIVAGATTDTITYASSDTLRSGARITKAMLLSSSNTPADYLLSFCKMFGIYFTYDNATRKVTLLQRDNLYVNETIDLTRRVDLTNGIEVNPMVFDKKWYDFILEGDGGEFCDEYENIEGIAYGIQRVNTGFDFNADSTNLMDSVVFKNACTILGRSKYFNYIFSGQKFKPSPFVDQGNTYTLWSASGETLETDISCPPTTAVVTYYNDNVNYRGYDIKTAGKLELRSSDNKPIDGSGILLMLEGETQYNYFKLTDDVPAMDVLNNGVPCWLLGAGAGITIPIFSRYLYDDDDEIVTSLDFGVPRQLAIPGVTYDNDCTLYARGWKNYLADRLDVNTKVMTCRVNFAGIQVNQALLRKFYWYDNSLWVLNRIINYSLTTYDPVECEFIQVQDKNNYLTGQNY